MLDAARERFLQDGCGATSVRGIAAAAAVGSLTAHCTYGTEIAPWTALPSRRRSGVDRSGPAVGTPAENLLGNSA